MALRIDGNFLAQVTNRMPQLNQPPVNTGEAQLRQSPSPRCADTDNVRGTRACHRAQRCASGNTPHHPATHGRHVARQGRAAGQCGCSARLAINHGPVTEPSAAAPLPAPESTRSTDDSNALGGIAAQGAGAPP